MKEFFKMLIKHKAKKILIIVVIIISLLLFFCSSLYISQLNDAVYDDSAENRDKNVPYIAQEEISTIFGGDETMDELGQITTKSISNGYALDFDIDELANNIIQRCQKNHTVLEDYIKDVETITKNGKTLRTSETLKLMIKAQIVTQYPDLRNVGSIRSYVGEDEFQGCIKFVRNRYDQETTLEYIPLGTEDDKGSDTLYGLLYQANHKDKLKELSDGYMGNDPVFKYFSLDTAGNLIIAEETRTDKKEAKANYLTAYEENDISDEEYKKYVDMDRENSRILEMLWEPEWEYKLKTINYSTAVSRYTMPFEYLWAFLVCGRDEQFVRDFANYVLDSEIDIGIYDNIATEESEKISGQANTNTWVKHKTITRVYEDWVLVSGPIDSGWLTPYDKPIFVPRFAKVERKMEYFDTIETSIIRADIWSMTTTEERSFIKPEHTNKNLQKVVIEQEKADDPETLWQDPILDSTDVSSIIETRKRIVQMVDGNGGVYEVEEEYDVTITTEIENWSSTSVWQNQKATTYADKEHNETQDRVEYYYGTGAVRTIPKDDKDADEYEPNFCTLYNGSGIAKYNLENSMEWFFEVLEKNASTVNLLPMTKYMLNKATGKDYGTAKVNFSLYAGGDISKITFASITNSSGGIDVSDENYFPTSVEQFRQGVKAYSNHQVLLQYADTFMECQEQYGVNAFFAATVSVWKTGAGTTGHGADGKNNMFNIRNSTEFNTYESKKQGIEAFYRLISGGTYFGAGKTTIANIGYTYCPNGEVAGQSDKWIRSVQSTMLEMLKKANIDISMISDMTIQEGKRGEATIFKVIFKGVEYITPIDIGTSGISVSSVAGKQRAITTNNGYQNRIHYGTDIGTGGRTGYPVYAAADGTIGLCGYQNAWKHSEGYGLRVYINHGNGIQTLYAHGSSLANGIKTGVKVKQGQLIMYSGNSGNTTGAHLHFEMKSGNYRYVDTSNAICGVLTTYGTLFSN